MTTKEEIKSTLSKKVTVPFFLLMTFGTAAMCALSALIFYFGYKIEDSQIMHMQDEIAAAKV